MWGFPGARVVKNPPCNARDIGLTPGPGRSHMPWSNSPCGTTTEPSTANTDACTPRAYVP